jgi:hypothetical protein
VQSPEQEGASGYESFEGFAHPLANLESFKTLYTFPSGASSGGTSRLAQAIRTRDVIQRRNTMQDLALPV